MGLGNSLQTAQAAAGGGAGVGGWVELGRTTLGSGADSIDVSSFADKRYLMLLASISEQSGSRIIFSSVAKKKDGMWVLSPTNRHIIDSGKILKIFVTENNADIDLEVTRENIVRKFSVRKDS